MMKIAIIGFGAIGKYVFDNLKKEKIFITSLICRPGREEAARKVLKSNILINPYGGLSYGLEGSALNTPL